MEYAAGLALFEISVVLDYCTRGLENPVVLQTTTAQYLVDLDVVA